MLCRLFTLPQPTSHSVPHRSYRLNTVQSRTNTFFSRRNNSQHSCNQPSISKDVNTLMRKAADLENSHRYKEAEQLYNEVVYNIDPTRKEAYDRLTNLWGKKSVFGFTHDKVDDLLTQYNKYVKKNHTDQATEKPNLK